MTPQDASRLLELPADATSEQLEARFLELRRRLEDKIAKAPTPGLQAKYRESLAQITTAFETLALAADSSGLPVLQKQSAPSSQPSASNAAPAGGVPPPRDQSSPSPAPKKSGGGKEFLIVAVIAVAVLGVGGWWVMKTRAENESRARLAAEAKAATEATAAAEKAEQDRRAEAKREADEEEKARIAAAAKAEQDRLDMLTAQLRGELAEYKIEWEAIEREERLAERQLSELKSDVRGLRDAPVGKVAEMQARLAAQQDYSEWLSDTLARHPARIARSRAEELLSARQLDLAQTAVGELRSALSQLREEIARQRAARLAVEGVLSIRTGPEVAWTLTDAFNRSQSGKGPALVEHVAFGSARVEFSKPEWPARVEAPLVSRSRTNEVAADFTGYELNLTSTPANAEVFADGSSLGFTPLRLTGLPPGERKFKVRKSGYHEEPVTVAVPQSTADRVTTVALRTLPAGLVRPERWVLPARLTLKSDYKLVMDYSGSTGLYANIPASTSLSRTTSEWTFSQPDEQGRWQQMLFRVLDQQHQMGVPIPTMIGTEIQYRRQANGSWQGVFLKGAPRDKTLRLQAGIFPAQWYSSLATEALWPEEPKQVGETWQVPMSSLPGLDAIDPKGMAEGKLLVLERTPDSDRAEIEYSYAVDTGPAGTRNTGTYRLVVDLREMYVVSTEWRFRSSSRTEATPDHVMVSEAQSTSTGSFTKH